MPLIENLGLVRGELDSSNSLESGYGNVELARISGQLHLDHSRDNAAVAIAVAGSSWPEFVLRSVCTVLLKARIKVLLPFGPLAIFVNYFYGDPGWVFFLSLLGITPLAERLGYATDALCGNAVGGLLNATFGNATEMIVSVFALKSGMIRVIQQSLLGSILSNLLMVLGCAFFVGGIVHHDKKVQVFNKAAAAVDCGFLLVSVMGIIIPAVLHATKTEVEIGKSELSLSRFSSCMMLLAYAAYLFFQLKSHQSLYNPINEACKKSTNERRQDNVEEEEEVPEITKWEAVSWLAILTVCVSVLSGYLVDAIQGASESSHLSTGFINVILIPIAGNSAAYATTIMFAIKDKQDITLGIAIGSSTQIAMFAIPFYVVIGWLVDQPMDLNFHLFETAILFVTVVIVAFTLQEGTSSYFKGLMLMLCYSIVGASFYVHSDGRN
ncbi:Vacuolar cation/proton exchanger 2 [Linum grandiflorum]